MKYRLKWAREARNDLAAIKSYIARGSLEVARSFVQTVLERCQNLCEKPFAAPMVQEFQAEHIGETNFGSYRTIFKIEGKSVIIARVFRGARLLTNDGLAGR